MRETVEFTSGPSITQKTIVLLLGSLACISIFGALYDSAFTHLFGVGGFQEFFSLSLHGVSHLYFWQPFSYLFVLQPYGGLNSAFFLSLLFFGVIIWSLGSVLLSALGQRAFLGLYFLSGIGSGLLATAVMAITHTPQILSGPESSIFALISLWALLYPEMEVLFLFTVRLKAKWIFLTLIGVTVLTSFSQLDYVGLSNKMAGALCGYLYGSFRFGRRTKTDERPPRAKIYDIRTRAPIVNEDAFVDQMLEKISKSGEASLTPQERNRLSKISSRKRK